MNLLAAVTPPFIYYGCSTWETLWDEKFILDEFTPVNMKSFSLCNVRKHRDIKDSDKYITSNILLNFGSMEKMRITSLEPKYCLLRSGKGLIIYLGLNTNVIPKKKGMVCHY